mmetsp:Transcript_107870/g.305152  ORF Transcript_107870/g.305152 Transcript_107870/m.305152 type:complete len:169 (-) Transcript_107870:84-590(-)
MYGGGGALPRAASQLLRDHSAQARSSSAPGPRQWATGLCERPRARRCVDLKVPKVGQKRCSGGALPPAPAPTRRPLGRILQETSGYERQDQPPACQGLDYDEEKRRHQDRCAFGFGSALPTVMAPCGLRPREEEPWPARGGPLAGRHVTFQSLPPSHEVTPRRPHTDG